MAKLTDQVFRHVLGRAQDVTDTFEIDLGGIPRDVVESHRQAHPHVQNVRALMEDRAISPTDDLSGLTCGLVTAVEWFPQHGASIQEALSSGDVVAVDGTPLIFPQRFLTAQVYACAVGALTYQNHLALKATVVKTQADPTLFTDQDATQQLIEESQRLSESQSWPAAFLEYQEHLAGLNHAARHVIIDGPLITQNLLTQTEGRRLFERMLGGRHKCYVGVSKDLRFVDVEERYEAMALRPGELFIRNTVLNLLEARIDKDYVGAIKRFAQGYLGDILRGIYKPGRKAFGFQCHRDNLGEVICLLFMDCHTQPGHEIPFLLEQVDSKLRGRYRPGETMLAVEAALASNDIDEFYDEAEERMFR